MSETIGGFVVDGRSRARWASWPDSAFPDFREGRMAPHAIIGELPRAGNGLWILCCSCWSQRWLGGQEICRRWPDWLLRPQLDWARALRCQGCAARRFAVHGALDPGAGGFQHGPEDTAPIVSARRLTAWLVGTGRSLDDVAVHLSGLPNGAERAALGL